MVARVFATADTKHVEAFVLGWLMIEARRCSEPRYAQEPYVADTINRVISYIETGNTNGTWSDLQCTIALECAKALKVGPFTQATGS